MLFSRNCHKNSSLRATRPEATVMHSPAQSWDELANPHAAVEAFADLVAGVHRGGAHFVDLQLLAEALESALEAGGRPPAEACGMLAGVLDDCAFDLVIARHALGEPLPTTLPSPNLTAGLTVRERLEMCKRLLERGPRPG